MRRVGGQFTFDSRPPSSPSSPSAPGSSHDRGTRRQESRCLTGYTSMIIVITLTTVITIIPTFFTIISPQLLVMVSDGRGIFHEGSSGARRPAVVPGLWETRGHD